MTYLWEFDVVALLDAQIDPLKDALVGFEIVVLDDQGTTAALELLAPDLAEDESGATGELGDELEQRLVLAGALPDGDELLLAVLAVTLEPVFGREAILLATKSHFAA